MNVWIASEAWICWSLAQPSEWKLWVLIWIWSWDPLKLCDVIRRTTSAPPRQNPAGQDPKRAFATSKSRQQRSDQTRKPVKSEQHNCSFDSNHGLRIAFPPGAVACFSVGTSGQSV